MEEIRDDLEKYKNLSEELLTDRPVLAPNGDIVAYRVADERERLASQYIDELVHLISMMENDLFEYSVCGTCESYQKHSPDGKQCHTNKGLPYPSMTTSGCHKWRWKGYGSGGNGHVNPGV